MRAVVRHAPCLLSKLVVGAIAVGALGAAGCRDHATPTPGGARAAGGSSEGSRAGPSPSVVLATVNGVPLTEVDLVLRQRRANHVDEGKPDFRKEILDLLIRDELVLQKAKALGFDSDPIYADAVRQMEAQLADLKRRKAAEVFFQREIADKTVVTEADARSYFDANAERLQTEVHVQQIFLRDKARIDGAKRDLDAGKPFDAVAKALIPAPEGQTPWDIGYLRWNQAPEAWRAVVYDMKPGSVTDVLSGPPGRYWLVKLIDRRRSDATFDSQKVGIIEALKAEKMAALRDATDKRLRDSAQIVYVSTP